MELIKKSTSTVNEFTAESEGYKAHVSVTSENGSIRNINGSISDSETSGGAASFYAYKSGETFRLNISDVEESKLPEISAIVSDIIASAKEA